MNRRFFLKLASFLPLALFSSYKASGGPKFPLPLKEAQRLHVCRLCGGTFLLHYGNEYCHHHCLIEERLNAPSVRRVTHIDIDNKTPTEVAKIMKVWHKYLSAV